MEESQDNVIFIFGYMWKTLDSLGTKYGIYNFKPPSHSIVHAHVIQVCSGQLLSVLHKYIFDSLCLSHTIFLLNYMGLLIN